MPITACRSYVPEIPDRIAYAEAITKGTTIFEEQPKGPGPDDFRALLAEIKELMQ